MLVFIHFFYFCFLLAVFHLFSFACVRAYMTSSASRDVRVSIASKCVSCTPICLSYLASVRARVREQVRALIREKSLIAPSNYWRRLHFFAKIIIFGICGQSLVAALRPEPKIELILTGSFTRLPIPLPLPSLPPFLPPLSPPPPLFTVCPTFKKRNIDSQKDSVLLNTFSIHIYKKTCTQINTKHRHIYNIPVYACKSVCIFMKQNAHECHRTNTNSSSLSLPLSRVVDTGNEREKTEHKIERLLVAPGFQFPAL